jgi:hypothetical protein
MISDARDARLLQSPACPLKADIRSALQAMIAESVPSK